MDELGFGDHPHLQDDARQSNQDIGAEDRHRAVHLPRTHPAAAPARVIRGYRADISLAALNRGVQALVPRRSGRCAHVVETFQSSVAALPEVLSVFCSPAATTS